MGRGGSVADGQRVCEGDLIDVVPVGAVGEVQASGRVDQEVGVYLVPVGVLGDGERTVVGPGAVGHGGGGCNADGAGLRAGGGDGVVAVVGAVYVVDVRGLIASVSIHTL